MRITCKLKSDTTAFKKFKKRVERYSVKVGYIDSPTHWNGGKDKLSVADIAAILHFDHPWEFMLDERNSSQVHAILKQNIRTLGYEDITKVLNDVGEDAVEAIRFNILNASSPGNSEKWAERKGFNDPLVFGSVSGEEPNLHSEVTYKVGVKRD